MRQMRANRLSVANHVANCRTLQTEVRILTTSSRLTALQETRAELPVWQCLMGNGKKGAEFAAAEILGALSGCSLDSSPGALEMFVGGFPTKQNGMVSGNILHDSVVGGLENSVTRQLREKLPSVSTVLKVTHSMRVRLALPFIFGVLPLLVDMHLEPARREALALPSNFTISETLVGAKNSRTILLDIPTSVRSVADSAPWIAPVVLMLMVQAFVELNLIHPAGPIRRLFFQKLPQIATIIGVSDACFALSALFWWNGETSFAGWVLVIFLIVKPITEWLDSVAAAAVAGEGAG